MYLKNNLIKGSKFNKGVACLPVRLWLPVWPHLNPLRQLAEGLLQYLICNCILSLAASNLFLPLKTQIYTDEINPCSFV
jgi:hypothetical protein